MKRFKTTGATADKTTPCRRKSVRVKKVVKAVKKRISRNPRRSRISPVLVPPLSRQVSGSSCMPRAEIYEFVHVVVIGIHFYVYLVIWSRYVLPFFIETVFRWVNLYGAPCMYQLRTLRLILHATRIKQSVARQVLMITKPGKIINCRRLMAM